MLETMRAKRGGADCDTPPARIGAQDPRVHIQMQVRARESTCGTQACRLGAGTASSRAMAASHADGRQQSSADFIACTWPCRGLSDTASPRRTQTSRARSQRSLRGRPEWAKRKRHHDTMPESKRLGASDRTDRPTWMAHVERAPTTQLHRTEEAHIRPHGVTDEHHA